MSSTTVNQVRPLPMPPIPSYEAATTPDLDKTPTLASYQFAQDATTHQESNGKHRRSSSSEGGQDSDGLSIHSLENGHYNFDSQPIHSTPNKPYLTKRASTIMEELSTEHEHESSNGHSTYSEGTFGAHSSLPQSSLASTEPALSTIPPSTKSQSTESSPAPTIRLSPPQPSESPSLNGDSAGATGDEEDLSPAELIARTEHTPTAWAVNFWVVLADPLTNNVFYACPATGDCSWDPPVGAMVLPASAEGEWWELSDKQRQGRSYYYHTKTQQRQWTRPPASELVIPLAMIQTNSLGRRVSMRKEVEILGEDSDAATPKKRESGRGRAKSVSAATGESGKSRDKGKSREMDRAGKKTLQFMPLDLGPVLGDSPSSSGSSRSRRHRTESSTTTPSASTYTLDSMVELGRHLPLPNGSITPFPPSQTGSSSRLAAVQESSPAPSVRKMEKMRVEVEILERKRGTTERNARDVLAKNGGSDSGHEQAVQRGMTGSASMPALNSITITHTSSGPTLHANSDSASSSPTHDAQAPATPTGKSKNIKNVILTRARGMSNATTNAEADVSSQGTGTGSEFSLRTPPADKKTFENGKSGVSGMFRRRGTRADGEDIGSGSGTDTTVQEARKQGGKFGRLRMGLTGGSQSMRNLSKVANGEDSDISAPSTFTNLRSDRNDMPKSSSEMQLLNRYGRGVAIGDGPINVELPMKTRRLSTGLHPLLPTGVSNDIMAFQKDDFSKRYFATQRQGLLRRKVPVEQVMEWQKLPITNPLLASSKSHQKEALRAFKVIQHVMGDRDRPVDGITTVSASASASNIVALAEEENEHPHDKDRIWTKAERRWLLEEQRWLLQLGIQTPEIRDEIYSQCTKQLTNNPDLGSMYRGFQLLCILVVTFPPSRDFASFLKTFLKAHRGESVDEIGIMSKYCLNKLDVIILKGPRSRALMYGELDQAANAAFVSCVFGESLPIMMRAQETTFPELPIPAVLPFLAQGIVSLGGLGTEGIFRIPGDGDVVSELKARLDCGNFHLSGIDDPNVASSLLKLWLRNLQEPLIPDMLYNEALEASRSPSESCNFVQRLQPSVNRRVLLFVICFLQMFLRPEIQLKTKMSPSNLALIFAPNLLRTTSSDATVVYTNAAFESKFVFNLLQHLLPGRVDPDFNPVMPQPPGQRVTSMATTITDFNGL